MRINRIVFAAAAALLVGLVPAAAQYQGSEWCADCHMDKYNEFVVSGHSYKLTPAEVAKNRPIPLPEGYSWDDVSYVIGGYKWKSRYIGTDGYILTTTGDGTPGMTQYNMLTGNWVDYHPGEEKPYDCGSCHTTGYSPDGNQDGLPGLIGTWEFDGVQCEQCHGPGFEMSVDRTADFCGSCHIRGDAFTIPAKGGFIRHHEQYNEQLASPHSDLSCVDCHNPHKKSEFSIHTTCEDCHSDYAEAYAGTVMDVRGVECIDCHMPYASKSAEALGTFKGDIRTHLFRINIDPDMPMFTEDGAFVQLDADGQGAADLNFACAVCHTDKGMGWIAGKAKNFHQKGTSLYSSDLLQ